jgi:hypothetical protein
MISAHLWHCGDEVCDCSQYVIERIRERCNGAGYSWERLWEGDFKSGRWSYPHEEQAGDLAAFRAAAARFGVELVEDAWGSWMGNIPGKEVDHVGPRHPIYPKRPAYGYDCKACSSWVINKDPGDRLFIGGPADGEWIVSTLKRVRVPVPADIHVLAASAEPSLRELTIEAAEYELCDDRRHYHFVSKPS